MIKQKKAWPWGMVMVFFISIGIVLSLMKHPLSYLFGCLTLLAVYKTADRRYQQKEVKTMSDDEQEQTPAEAPVTQEPTPSEEEKKEESSAEEAKKEEPEVTGESKTEDSAEKVAE